MPRLIAAPTVIAAAGTKPKRIEEFAGRVNSGHAQISVARMTSPSGWEEPGQRPEFEEITVVLRGMVRVEHEGGVLDVRAGQAVVTSPASGFATARRKPTALSTSPICLPAFSPDTVHRDE
jgi:mannose-6-phosphate isomerase-like protein (cupin superfamily)